MTLHMERRFDVEKLERKVGKLAIGIELAANHPGGIDLSTAGGRTDLEGLGLAPEFIAATVFDKGQREAFVSATVEERKTLLGVTTQEEIATEVLSEDLARKETAIGIMLDLNRDDVLRASNATEKALIAFGGDVAALRDRLSTWVYEEVEDAAQSGRLTP